MSQHPDPLQTRQADHPIEALILKRWSARAMSGEPVSQEHLFTLFEAARWAPSSYNEQEWRFVYCQRGSTRWEEFLGFLGEGNRAWCKDAGVLIVVMSKKTFARNGHPNESHSLDTGMACQNLMLQAAALGLVSHPMVGFNKSVARTALSVPDDFQVEVMIAVGHYGEIVSLPENYQKMDRQPSGRKDLSAIASEEVFSFS